MNPFAAIETWCGDAVERAFALAFPLALEPVHIARKLVAAFESTIVPGGTTIARIAVRVSPRDAHKLEPDRAMLERQWADMLARLAVRAGRPDRPAVSLESTRELPRGVVNLAVEVAEPSSAASMLVLSVQKGVPLNAHFPLNRSLVIGRDPACDVVLMDPRVSRRHLRVNVDGETARFEDLDSANGVLQNGRPQPAGTLREGDVLRVGDSELVVVAAGAAAP